MVVLVWVGRRRPGNSHRRRHREAETETEALLVILFSFFFSSTSVTQVHCYLSFFQLYSLRCIILIFFFRNYFFFFFIHFFLPIVSRVSRVLFSIRPLSCLAWGSLLPDVSFFQKPFNLFCLLYLYFFLMQSVGVSIPGAAQHHDPDAERGRTYTIAKLFQGPPANQEIGDFASSLQSFVFSFWGNLQWNQLPPCSTHWSAMRQPRGLSSPRDAGGPLSAPQSSTRLACVTQRFLTRAVPALP